VTVVTKFFVQFRRDAAGADGGTDFCFGEMIKFGTEGNQGDWGNQGNLGRAREEGTNYRRGHFNRENRESDRVHVKRGGCSAEFHSASCFRTDKFVDYAAGRGARIIGRCEISF